MNKGDNLYLMAERYILEFDVYIRGADAVIHSFHQGAAAATSDRKVMSRDDTHLLSNQPLHEVQIRRNDGQNASIDVTLHNKDVSVHKDVFSAPERTDEVVDAKG